MAGYFLGFSAVAVIAVVIIIVQVLVSKDYDNLIFLSMVVTVWVLLGVLPTIMGLSIDANNKAMAERKAKTTAAFYECVDKGNELEWCVANVGSPSVITE